MMVKMSYDAWYARVMRVLGLDPVYSRWVMAVVDSHDGPRDYDRWAL